jgi:uncharacterized protein YabN with tetrapyrrole methylase and pyrophosphatase domain
MTGAEAPRTGSLSIVGSGIRLGLHTTEEARVRIEGAGKVLYLLAETAPAEWIKRLNPSAESLAPLYRLGRDRGDVYEDLVTAMLDWVRRGEDVCVVTYGNPAVFDRSSHEAVRRARAEGFQANIFPGVSALDCLFVDLGLDPGLDGLQSYEATDFLVFARIPDTRVPLILWQVSVIGVSQTADTVNMAGVQILAERLAELYGEDHEVIVYEASPFPVGRSLVQPSSLKGLETAVTGMSTLYVPPTEKASPDSVMVKRLASS